MKALMSGLVKLFYTRRHSTSPHKYTLTSKEKERVILFFAILGLIIPIFLVLLALYRMK
jgi:uncharacterized protein (DUF1015 family)